MKRSPSLLMAIIPKGIKAFHFVENFTIVVGLSFIFVSVLLQCVFRYLIRSMPLGLEEMALIVASWIYFIGLGVATRIDNHIVIDIIDQVGLPKKLKKIVFSFGDLLVVFISGWFTYYSISYAYSVHKTGIVIPPFNISDLFKVGPLAIGMILATVYATVRMVRRLIEHFG